VDRGYVGVDVQFGYPTKGGGKGGAAGEDWTRGSWAVGLVGGWRACNDPVDSVEDSGAVDMSRTGKRRRGFLCVWEVGVSRKAAHFRGRQCRG
jgi:hypothetical protein